MHGKSCAGLGWRGGLHCKQLLYVTKVFCFALLCTFRIKGELCVAWLVKKHKGTNGTFILS